MIKAKRGHVTGDSSIIELIPQEKLKGDLPAVLIEEHAHWLNLSTSVMEIRPLGSLWEASSENWKIDCTPGKYRMQKGNEFLVDIRSQSWDMVSNLLRPFDAPQNLLVSVSPTDSCQPISSLRLSVALPRYGLSFYVDEDEDLQSYNIRGMVYDENQSVGTLSGLVNRLVLRPKIKDANAAELNPRCVLIPEGDISFGMDGHHVCVKINTRHSTLDRVTYQSYRIDTDMGCLTGNVSLTNKLYCAYLHALTSGCSTDPLTGRSGTEEALSILRSASCWSIMRFGSREAQLLKLIASICPTRTWYPEHLKCMQRVNWPDLPVSAEHHELYVVARGIKEHCERVLLFQESQSSTLFRSFPLHDEHLPQRSALRAAYLSPSQFSGQPPREIFDVWYSARDLLKSSSGEQRAYTAASAVHHRTASATTTRNIPSMVESWRRRVSGDATLSLQYDKSWLDPDLPPIWLKAYKLLRSNDEGKWFQLLFSLPAMAYHEDSSESQLNNLVPVFVAFASDSRFRLEDPPHYDSYNLSEGYQPSPDTLRSYVSHCAHSFERSPESNEPARPGESLGALRMRQVTMYNNRRDSDSNTTVERLSNAWPCETLPWCSLDPTLYDVSGFTSNAQSHFSSCYGNLKLKEHLTRVQSILNDAFSHASPTPAPHYSFQPSQSIPPHTSWLLAVDRLFVRPAPSLQIHDGLPSESYAADNGNSPFSRPTADATVFHTRGGLSSNHSLLIRAKKEISDLFTVLGKLRTWSNLSKTFYRVTERSASSLHQLIATVEANAVNPFQEQYVSALRTSAECFESEMSLVTHEATKLPTAEILLAHYVRCRANYIEARDHVKQHLGPRSLSEQAVEQSGQWPRITAHTLLRSLASSSPIILPGDWKKCLTQLTLLALELQRARRLLRLHFDNLPEELRKEVENEGCDGWDAEAHPDWLLTQVCFSSDRCIHQNFDATSLVHHSYKATFWFVAFKLRLPMK